MCRWRKWPPSANVTQHLFPASARVISISFQNRHYCAADAAISIESTMKQFHFIKQPLQLRLESMSHLQRWKWHNYVLSRVYKSQTNSRGQWIWKVAFPRYLFESFGAQWHGGQSWAHSPHKRSCFYWASCMILPCFSRNTINFS